jgi:hypothetical protein
MNLLERVSKLELWVKRHDLTKMSDIVIAQTRQRDIDTRIDEVEARINNLTKAVELSTNARDEGEER